MSKDARHSVRIKITNEPWTLRYSREDESLESPIDDVSSQGLAITPPYRENSPFHVGASVEQVYIVSQYRTYGPLNFRIKRITFQLDIERIHVAMMVDDDNSDAIMKQVYQDLYGLLESEPEPSPEWIPIPARGDANEQSRLQRLNFLRERTAQPLSGLEHCYLDPADASTKVENFIGSIEMPVGVAGPLHFHGERVSGPIYAPFATNETSLVASAARGSKAMSMSGGVSTRVMRQSIRLNPLMIFENHKGANYFTRWLLDHKAEMADQIQDLFPEIDRVEIWPHSLGTKVHISLHYTLAESGSLSKVKQATWTFIQRCLDYMLPKESVTIENFVIDSSFQGDTPADRSPLFSGNGIQVIAEAMITEDVAQTILKSNLSEILAAYRHHQTNRNLNDCKHTHLGLNHTLPSLLMATGQSLSSMVDTCIGQFYVEPVDGGLYTSLILPRLDLETVGKGTSFGHQQQCLELIECHGPGKQGRLAEIVAGFSLALEVSGLASLAKSYFSVSRRSFLKNHPVECLRMEHLDKAFFTPILQTLEGTPGVLVESLSFSSEIMNQSYFAKHLIRRKLPKFVGLTKAKLRYRVGQGDTKYYTCVVKSLLSGQDVQLVIESITKNCGELLSSYISRYQEALPYRDCHEREWRINREPPKPLVEFLPKRPACYRQSKNDAYVVIMEDLGNKIGSIIQDSKRIAEKLGVLHGQLRAHAHSDLYMPHIDQINVASILWGSLVVNGKFLFPEWYDDHLFQHQMNLLAKRDTWLPEWDACPKTMIHGRLNQNHMAFHNDRLTLIDWSYSSWNIAQHDLIDFMIHLHHQLDEELLNELSQAHWQALSESSERDLSQDEWQKQLRLALKFYTVFTYPLGLLEDSFQKSSKLIHFHSNLIRILTWQGLMA
ncbi:phosphotransferase [Pseudobacteriovorax antillogorgiicola]|uniref:3-hydroxy-3-methylglutaryl-coenzyme A reductase n=1 Tax=Pseudobacteriovorax antillogorgiicola TaxID=1513793 RepID=A0A1Y6CHW4_9BACT|nr:phosphotransferase [Pseudobacteriovorax antillogorgiicola]TCS47031.1 3-hydroxy-3-methylglutaryl-coenzyme A reductase [Pseudobacteriovorax antillogorgiicola]SMF65298.1 3-hydroxy-3-methylglutaryl-coenzyme A reductase [Pseudobacteriovorax antillogorgiicola]